MKEYDFVVIGSGIAGLSFALKAAKARLGRGDHKTQRRGHEHGLGAGRDRLRDERRRFVRAARARHARSRRRALCDEAVVRTIVTEGPARIRELVDLGLQFDEREVSGHREFDLGRKAAIRSGAFCTCTT